MNTKYLVECATILKDLDTEEPSHQKAISMCENYLHHAYEIYNEDCINYNMQPVSEQQFFLELMSLDEGIIKKIAKGAAIAGAAVGTAALAAKGHQAIANQKQNMENNGQKNVTFGQAAKSMINSNKAEGAGGFRQNLKAATATAKQVATTKIDAKNKLSSLKQGFSNGGGFSGAKQAYNNSTQQTAQNGGSQKLANQQQAAQEKSKELQNKQLEKVNKKEVENNNKLNNAKQNLEQAGNNGDEKAFNKAQNQVDKYNKNAQRIEKKKNTYNSSLNNKEGNNTTSNNTASEAKPATTGNVNTESLNMTPIEKISFYSSSK